MPRQNILAAALPLALTLLGACAGQSPAPAEDATPAAEKLPEGQVQPLNPEEPPADVGATSLRLDPAASRVLFTGSRPAVAHTRAFSRIDGRLHLTEDEPAFIEVLVDMTSITAGPEDKLVQHLKSVDFFDVARFPNARFRSSRITPLNLEQSWLVEGLMEVHGKHVPLRFPATVTRLDDGGVRGVARFTINRRDYDVSYEMKDGGPIEDSVTLDLDLTFRQGAAPAPAPAEDDAPEAP